MKAELQLTHSSTLECCMWSLVALIVQLLLTMLCSSPTRKGARPLMCAVCF